jgi:hypothetical protein
MIDIKTICENDLNLLRELVENPKFSSDIKMQNKAVLIARGIDIKVRSMETAAGADGEKILKELRDILLAYGAQYNKQTIDLNVGVTSVLAPDEIPKPEDAGR